MKRLFYPLCIPFFTAYFLLGFCAGLRAGCVDSLHISLENVQCKGFRNGKVLVTAVFGGQPPYYFSLDGVNFSTRPEFEFLKPGEYRLLVRDASADSCLYTRYFLITEPDLLQVKLIADDNPVISGTVFRLRAEIAPVDAVLHRVDWTSSQGLFFQPGVLEQSGLLADSTEIIVDIEDVMGCKASDRLFLGVKPAEVFFPNVIAPGNNENGYFTAYSGEGVSRLSVLQVFNRSGNMVFERRDFSPNDPLKGWNGRWRGRQASSGVYSWRAVVEFSDGRVGQYAGSVTVVN